MKSLFLMLIPLFLTAIPAIGQKVYRVTIVDAQNGRPISKATIKVISKQISLETDLNGQFTLSTESIFETDTLIISYVGYISKKVPVYGLAVSSKIKLVEAVKSLKELTILKTKYKSVVLNKFSKTIPFFIGLKMAAQKMFLPQPGAVLNSIVIVRSLEKGKNSQARFKVHIFDVDPKTGSPGAQLLESGIEVTDIGNEKINVDLKDHYLIIQDKAFFVGIEWLYIPYNQYINVHKEMLPVTIYENGTQVPWTDYIGNSDYTLGIQGAAPKDDKTYQIVKTVTTAQPAKLDENGSLIRELVPSLSFMFNPRLNAVVGEGISHIWILQNDSNSQWESGVFRPGARLAMSVSVSY